MTAMLNTPVTATSVTMPTKELYSALVGVDKLLTRRPYNAVLGGVLVESDGEQLTMTAYDYDTLVRYTAPVVGEPLRVLVDARGLLGIVRNHGRKVADVTELAVDGSGVVSVRQGVSVATMAQLPIADLPALPAVPAGYRVVEGAEFDGCIARVGQACGSDDTLPVLTGLYVEHSEGHLELAATDRYKLAADSMVTTELGALPVNMPAVLWRHAVVAKAVKVFGAKHGPVTLHCDADTVDKYGTVRVGWSTDRWLIVSTALDGEFPRYRNLFPTSVEHEFSFDRASLVAAVTAIGKARWVTFTVTGDVVTLDGTAGDDTALSSSVPVVRVSGADDTYTFALAPERVLQTLKAWVGDRVLVASTTPTRPFLFTSPYRDTARTLVMPYRLPA